MTSPNSSSKFFMITGLFTWLGCGLFTYGVINWTDYPQNREIPGVADFGWSFYVCWVSGLFTFISGLLETQGVDAKDFSTSGSRRHAKPPVNY